MPHESEVKREPGRQGSRQQYVNLATEAFELSADTFQSYYNRLQRWYDLYRLVYQGRFSPYRNNIAIPLLFSVCQSDVARKVGMILGNYPYVSFTPGGPEDQALARKREALVNRQLDDARTYDKAVRFLLGADLYGTMPYRHYWEKVTGPVRFRADFGNGEREFAGEADSFNGPQWEPVDPRDFFPAPGYATVEAMPWVVHRYWMELEDVIRHGESGYFDREGTADASFSPPPSVQANFMERRDPAQGAIDGGHRHTKFEKPVEIIEYWGRVPRALAIDDEQMCVITIANRKHLLRARPNPYWKKIIPFGAYSPMADTKYFHAPGKIEIGEKLQYASNRIANQKMDALDLFIDPVFLYNRRAGLDVRNLRMRPGRWFGADGDVSDANVRPLVPDLRGLSTAYTELEQQWRWIQQGTGIVEDIVQGGVAGGSDRQTAREWLGRSEAVSNRIVLETRLAERQWLEPLATQFVELDRQFLPFPQTVRMLGASAVLDPVTLQPLMEQDQIGVNDLLPDYDTRALGATRQLGKAAIQQNMVTALQAIQANPIALQTMNWVAFFRQFLTAFDFQNVDELMNTQSLVQAAAQQVLANAPKEGTGGQVSQPAGGDGAPNDLMTSLVGLMGEGTQLGAA